MRPPSKRNVEDYERIPKYDDWISGEIEEGCDECCGSGRTTTKNDKEYRAALQIICGRRISPTEAIANLSASELAAAVLDGKLLNKL